jgi:hypothetical protein
VRRRLGDFADRRPLDAGLADLALVAVQRLDLAVHLAADVDERRWA